MISSMVGIMTLSVVSSAFTEGMSWYLIYSKPAYQKLKRSIERTAKEFEKKKNEVIGVDKQNKKEKHEKTLKRLEKDMSEGRRDLGQMKVKSMFIMAITMMVCYRILNKTYSGIVVAKLPFEPVGLVRNVTHRGLEGDDFTDCSMTFLFVMCSMGFRGNITKAVGLGLPKGLGNENPLFADISNQYDELQKNQ